MSDDEIIAGPPGAVTADLQAPDLKPRYKSWRKKYRKMKARFDDVMKENSTMFKEEQKLESLSKRLQEQNDQLLDLLLEFNSTVQVPTSLRYDVSLPKPSTEYDDIDLGSANHLLYEAHQAVQDRRFTEPEFRQLRHQLESSLTKHRVNSLADLEEIVPHAVYNPDQDDIPPHLADTALQAGFLNSAHEDDYLQRIDAKLSPGSKTQSRAASPVNFTNMTPRELEREVELRNPVSVHNWLKKHNVSINVEDAASEAGGPPTTIKKGRNLAKKVGDRALERARETDAGSPMGSTVGPKVEQDADEDLGHGEETPGSKGKRARDADETYRPKGGRSGKTKRKREDGEIGSSKKKPKTSIGGTGEVML